VFHGVANNYDIMNDLMSGGMHHVWKDKFVATLNPYKNGAYLWFMVHLFGHL
jgi:demethylmenaquinone methyltransferase/2-methoxy-6-polyprenyl-1,4-benzoquinol methylase